MSRKNLVSELSVADFITLTATMLIVIAIWLLWHGQIYLSIALAFAAMFLDYLDGTIARKYGASSYGKVLDSLFDIIGFVLFPSLVVNLLADWAWWSLAITTTYYLSATLRLARFTIQGFVENNKRYYVGLPVLFSKYALLVAFVWGAKLSAIILAVMIPMMISSKLVRKPHPLFAQFNLIYAAIFLLLYLR